MPHLLLKKKAEIIAEYIFDNHRINIGSDEQADIRINDPSISAAHGEVYPTESGYFVKDLSSAFGTYVSKERITVKKLESEDHIILGNSVYTLIFVDDAGDKNIRPLRYELIGIQGKFAGKKYELQPGETKIGRDEDYNDVILLGKIDPSVSRRHTTIHYDDKKFTIADRRSRNRTYVNDREIKEQDIVPLVLGDEIVIGHTIFRFCTSEYEDFSHPKKASTFIERIKIPFLHAMTLGVFLLSLGIVLFSLRNILIIQDVPETPTLEKTAWSPSILQEDPPPLLSPVYDISISPALGCIGPKKTNGIIGAFPYGKVYAWDASDGKVLWDEPVNILASISVSPSLYDLNHDGADDILITGGDSKIYAIDGMSGKLIYKSQLLGGILSGAPAAGDINRDGTEDLVVCSQDGNVYILFNPLGNANSKQLKVENEVLAPAVIYRGTTETTVIVATINGKIYFYNGSTLSSKSIDTAESINKFIGSHLPINEITSAPAVADIDGDKEPELVVLSNQYYVAAVNINTLDLEWIYHIEPPSIKEPPKHFSSPLLTDLNHNGLPDVIITAPNGKILALDGKTGQMMWEYSLGDWNRIIASPAPVDIDKDGIADFAIGSEDGGIYIISGNTQLEGAGDRLLCKNKNESAPITATPCAGDVDNDGYIDIVVSYADTTLQMYRTNTRTFKGSLFSPMLSMNAAHTGLFMIQNYMSKAAIYIGSAVAAVLAMCIIQLITRRKLIKNRPKQIVIHS